MILDSKDINMENPRIIEELTHYMQDNIYSGGIYQYAKIGKANIEFEAKVIQDLYNYVRANGHLNRAFSIVLINILEDDITDDEYIDFLSSIINGTMTNASYFNMLDKFTEHTDIVEYKTKINLNLSPELLNLYGNSFNCIK